MKKWVRDTKNKTVLFSSELSLDTPIYRVMKIEHLFEMINTNKNTLVMPRSWDDSYEQWYLDKKYKESDGREVRLGSKDGIFAQCWSLNSDNDMVWRVYSPDKNGVQIQTTIGKLIKSVRVHITIEESLATDFAWIGEVRYLDFDLFPQVENINTLFSRPHLANLLLLKRIAFQHEREIRLIIVDLLGLTEEGKVKPHTEIADKFEYVKSERDNSVLLKYPIVPTEFIDGIIFNPWLNDSLYQLYASKLEGFAVKKSDIYKDWRDS